MKTIIYRYSIALFLCLFLSGMAYPVLGQKKKKQTKTVVRMEIVDAKGNPLEYSEVSSSRNRHTYTADGNGVLTLALTSVDMLKIKADGYASKVVSAADIIGGKKTVALEKLPEYEGENHIIHTLAGNEMSERRSVGAYSKVEGEDLEENPTMFLWDALGGRLGGLYLMNNALVPGFTSYDGFVRAPNGGAPIIMIDGVERSLDYVEPETIESVTFLKDASLKALYGGVQANGIIMIKTKRGQAYENGVRVNVQSGVSMPTRLPYYLNSSEYVEKYNEALSNVGRLPVYDPSKYDGSDPLRYPDVDFYDMFLNKVMTITRANAQLSGGNINTQYFLNLGFQTNGGLEKFTDSPNRDQVLTVRGNIDNTIFGFITLKVGLNAAIQKKKWPNISTQNFFNILSETRPNEYPVMIPGELVGKNDELFVLGGTMMSKNNPLGALTRNGYVEREYSYLQSDFTIDFDFNKWVKGLRIRPGVTFDIYNEYSSRKDGGYSVYELIYAPDGTVAGFNNWGYDNPNTKQVRGGVATRRNWVFNVVAEYDRVFGKHELTALATYFMQQKDFDNSIHSLRRVNTGAMVNYAYDRKLIVDASVNFVGLPSFAWDKRFGCFPTVGLGWAISEHSFMANADWVDYLKLRASYGMLGSTSYDSNGVVSKYYYRDEWAAGGTYPFTSFDNIVSFNQTGNPNVGFQRSHEINAGIDFEFFNHSFSGTVGYFRNTMVGGLANFSDIIPGVSGKGGILLWDNYREIMSQGAEVELYYNKRFGDFSMTVGGNFNYGYSEVTREVDMAWPDELSGLAKVLRSGDSKGYVVEGVFGNESDIESSPVQTFGKVYPGDFKYKDLNSDNIIDERDRKVIANVRPSMSYGITLKFRYKGFNLDLLGYGLAGFDRMLTNKYYQIYGNRKYSCVVNTGLPNGNPHPVLRADSSTNNFVASDYWVVDGGYFKLRNAELGYTLPYKASKKIGLNRLKFFVRGTNLFTISKIKDLDPESLEAGVGDFPLCTTLTGGLSFSF